MNEYLVEILRKDDRKVVDYNYFDTEQEALKSIDILKEWLPKVIDINLDDYVFEITEIKKTCFMAK